MHKSFNQQHQQQHKLISPKREIQHDFYQQLSDNRMVYGDLSSTDLFASALFWFFQLTINIQTVIIFLKKDYQPSKINYLASVS